MALEHDQDSALAKAIRSVGSQTAFGDLIGKRQSVVSGWLIRGAPLPAEHVLAIEAATGISRHELRPDIYPIETPAPSDSLPDGRTRAAQDPAAAPGAAPRSVSCDQPERGAHLPKAAAEPAPLVGKAAG